ncbi:MAG TPA: hypothetical protein VHO69_00430, partial [Phototrophicaceae bacterium]|nr:hypothetical protein [Phototrophicaceae bacterium]
MQPEATEAATVLPPTEVPTEIPTEVPPVVTTEPTAEITPVVTAETTAEATLPVEITPIVSPTAPALPPEPILALLTRAMFDNGDVSAWTLGANWFVIPNETGMGLQIANAADSLQLVQGPFYNAAAQVDLRLTGGSIHLSLRQSDVGAYSVALDAAGQLTLYRADVPVQSVTLALPATPWQTLRLSAMQDIIRVAVNGTEVFAWQDVAPLPPGFAKIA